jgi:hypothetical protein
MPPIKFTAFKHCMLLTTLISLNREIMNPYSYYIKKGLVYIALISPFKYQLSFYLKCTKVNIQLFYNIYSVLFNKYIYFTIHY